MQVVLPRGYRGSCLHAYDANQSGKNERSALEIVHEPTTDGSEHKVRRGQTKVDT